MKKLLQIAIVGIFTFCLTTGCGSTKDKKNEDKVESNTNEDVIKDQVVGELELTNTSLVTTNGQSQLVTMVSNKTDHDIVVDTFDIYVKDKDGNNITVLVGYVGGVVPKGETRNIVSNSTMNLGDSVSIEYKINK